MSRHPETNPYFIQRPLQRVGQPSTPPSGQGVTQRQPQRRDRDSQPLSPGVTQPKIPGQRSQPQGPLLVPPRPDFESLLATAPGRGQRPQRRERRPDELPPPQQHDRRPDEIVSPQQQDYHPQEAHIPGPYEARHPIRQQDRNRKEPSGPMIPPGYPQDRDQSSLASQTGRQQDRNRQEPRGTVVLPKQRDQPSQASQTGRQQDRHPQEPHAPGVLPTRSQESGLRVPPQRRTKALTWFCAAFCAIFWIVVIIGGLIVLIIYLVYRPHNPQFQVSSVTLNAAYIDADSLLNADLSVLANFSNPNKKVSVDFHYIIVDLYYGNTLIATQYIEPFSAAKAESRFANVHLISSQVRLPLGESQRLQDQINKNGVIFEVRGVFHVRSNLGEILRYSYWLYGHCSVMVTAPPSGVLTATKCRTKR